MRALFAHEERCQREADQEAQDRASGKYDPVFLEPSVFSTEVTFSRGRKPPKFAPKFQPFARFDDAYSHDDHWLSKLSGAIPGSDIEPWLEETMAAVEAERPFCSPQELVVLDWMVKRNRTQTEVGADLGMGKSAISKIVKKLAERLRTRLEK